MKGHDVRKKTTLKNDLERCINKTCMSGYAVKINFLLFFVKFRACYVPELLSNVRPNVFIKIYLSLSA